MASASRHVLFGLATSERFGHLARGLPGGERVAYRLASRYIAGRELTDALSLVRELAEDGLTGSVDFFGESVIDRGEAERVATSYRQLGAALEDAPAGTFLSLDLSHIGIDEPGDAARIRLERIHRRAPGRRRGADRRRTG
jgi:proline dehydrogenase